MPRETSDLSGCGSINRVTSGIWLFRSWWLSGVDITDLCCCRSLMSLLLENHRARSGTIKTSRREWRCRPCVLGILRARPLHSQHRCGWGARTAAVRTDPLSAPGQLWAAYPGDLGTFPTRTERHAIWSFQKPSPCSSSNPAAFPTSSWHVLALILDWILSDSWQTPNVFPPQGQFSSCSCCPDT